MSAVLAVVLMVLKIIGMILLALLLLLLLALLLPAGIHFRWSHIGGLHLQLCYGPLHFTLYPRKADEEEKKAEPKAETKQGNTPKTEPTPPPAKAELPAQPTMKKQTEPTEAKPAKAPEEPQKAEPAPPAEKEQGKPKAPETSPQPGREVFLQNVQKGDRLYAEGVPKAASEIENAVRPDPLGAKDGRQDQKETNTDEHP